MAASVGSSSRSACTYHVFLSFRGEDTRRNFSDHLYTALVQAGFHTFRDDDKIKRGENIMEALMKGLRESKVHIIVFSKDYASSTWCLNELLKIMEHSKTGKHDAVPIFYDVDPSQVRGQTGSFAEAFARHEEVFKEEISKVEAWRQALREITQVAGMVLENRYEAQFIQDIVKIVGSKLNRTALFVAPYLVGIHNVTPINLWLQDGSHDASVAIISGVGGIGKTTAAKIVYNWNFDRFESSSFLANINQTSEQRNGLARLQKQLICQILKGEKYKIHNVDEGLIKIKDAVCCRNVLLVLDDVDTMEQLRSIIGNWEWFNSGSKIIITTTNEHLIRTNNVKNVFRIKELGTKESLELFSWYAFGRCYPVEGYMEFSRNIVQHCGGLPLALQALGSSLCGKSINLWGSALDDLKTIPNSQVQKILRMSYDSLEDNRDKNLFLDIACFFTGKNKDFATRILSAFGYDTPNGIQNLIDRCLLSVNLSNELCMHTLIRDMGRNFIRQESPEDPGRRSRLWNCNDAFTVLRDKRGTDSIKGLTLDMLKLKEEQDSGRTKSVRHELSLLDMLSSKELPKPAVFELPVPDVADLEIKAFSKMSNIKLLQLNYVKLNGNYKDFPKSLVWLCWDGFPLKCIPTSCNLSNVAVLEMRKSSLRHAWKKVRSLLGLKILDLSHSHSLLRTPNFSGLPNLERLNLKYCTHLIEVDASIGDLTRLISLNLKGCKKLMKLPKEIGTLKSLQNLNLWGCSTLGELPEDLRKMESLVVLHLDGISLAQSQHVVASTRKLDLLRSKLMRSTVPPLRRYPRSLRFSFAFLPKSLHSMYLAYCNITDNDLPNDLSVLPILNNLVLSGNPISTLPESISNLTKLMSVILDRCSELRSLPKLPETLIEFRALHCTSLESLRNIPNPSFSIYMLFGCEKLVGIPGMFKLEPITDSLVDALSSLWMFNLESVRNSKATLRNVITDTKWEKAPLKVLSECGILSIFICGNEFPSWFTSQNGPIISFHVPPVIGSKVCGLNICGVYAFKELFKFETNGIIVVNETKGTRWTYVPSCYGVPGDDEDMLWLSHWKFENLLECGDHVIVYVDMGYNFQVSKCGVFLVYASDKEDVLQINPSRCLTKEIYKDSEQRDGYYFDNIRGRDHLWLRRTEEVVLKCQQNSLSSRGRLLTHSPCYH